MKLPNQRRGGAGRAGETPSNGQRCVQYLMIPPIQTKAGWEGGPRLVHAVPLAGWLFSYGEILT